jgi:hypothetical protein
LEQIYNVYLGLVRYVPDPKKLFVMSTSEENDGLMRRIAMALESRENILPVVFVGAPVGADWSNEGIK